MEELFKGNLLIIVLVALWSLPWKGVALWKAGRLNQKWWFIVLLVVNTLAILDILYLFVFSKKHAAGHHGHEHHDHAH